jgi:hypothetical protein
MCSLRPASSVKYVGSTFGGGWDQPSLGNLLPPVGSLVNVSIPAKFAHVGPATAGAVTPQNARVILELQRFKKWNPFTCSFMISTTATRMVPLTVETLPKGGSRMKKSQVHSQLQSTEFWNGSSFLFMM